MTTLAKLPKEERPRERLLFGGEESLSLIELLALSLGNGRKGVSALALAEELVATFGGLASLMEATLSELMAVKGIGLAKAARLKMASALARRQGRDVGLAKYPVRRPEDAHAILKKYFQGCGKEMAVAIFRDIKGNAFYDEVIAIGTLSQVLVHPRELFYAAIRHRAYSLILAHNHPSGDPRPSRADVKLTKLLIASGKVVGVPLDDHLIIGRTQYVSLWREGSLFCRSQY